MTKGWLITYTMSVFGQVGLYGVNLIGQPTSTATSDGDW